MPIDKYFDTVKNLLDKFSSFVLSKTITFESRSTALGKIKGTIIFIDSSKLHIIEIVDTEQSGKIYYSYHYQSNTEGTIFRYDNAPHHKEIKTFPHHKHLKSSPEVYSTSEPELRTILKEIVSLLSRAI